jgi:hypothetical protein
MNNTDQANADSMAAQPSPAIEPSDATVLNRTGDLTTLPVPAADGIVYLEHRDRPMAHAQHYYPTPRLLCAISNTS